MTTTKVLAVLCGLALLLGGLSTATATTTPTGTFESHGGWGVMTLTADPGSAYFVYGEQANGSYMQQAAGVIGSSGSTTLNLVEQGPWGDGLPAYHVTINRVGGGQDMLNLSDILDKWWFD